MIKELNSIKPQTIMLISGAALLLWVMTRGAKNTGKDIGAGVVDFVAGTTDGLVSGVVIGMGKAVGIPETNKQKCILAQKNGDTFEASKYCTAGEFIDWKLLNKKLGVGSGASGSW